MLKQNATWEQIQNAWHLLTRNEKIYFDEIFDRTLRNDRPDIHKKLATKNNG